MEIRKVGGINPLEQSQAPKAPKLSPSKNSSSTDSLRVSDEAHLLEDEAFFRDVLSRISEIDQEKVDRIKAQIESGEYNNSEAIDKLASRLSKILGL